MKVFYFGCGREAGHYMFAPGLTSRRAESDFTYKNPWGTKIDGGLVPQGGSYHVQGLAQVHHKDGWTALSFCDLSVDQRPGSVSTFLAEGEHSFATMVQLARRHFPEVTARYTFEITDAGAPK